MPRCNSLKENDAHSPFLNALKLIQIENMVYFARQGQHIL